MSCHWLSLMERQTLPPTKEVLVFSQSQEVGKKRYKCWEKSISCLVKEEALRQSSWRRTTVCLSKQFTPKSEKKEDTEVERSDDNKRGQRKAAFETHTCLVWRQFMTPDTKCSSLFFPVLSFSVENCQLFVDSYFVSDAWQSTWTWLPPKTDVRIHRHNRKVIPPPFESIFLQMLFLRWTSIRTSCSHSLQRVLEQITSFSRIFAFFLVSHVRILHACPHHWFSSIIWLGFYKKFCLWFSRFFPVLFSPGINARGTHCYSTFSLCVSRESIRDFRQSIDCLIGSLFSSRVWFLNEIQ